jgi:hypothetical protein
MNSKLGRCDLKRIHQTVVGNFQFLRVTAGTLAWNALYAIVLSCDGDLMGLTAERVLLAWYFSLSLSFRPE